MFSIEKVYSGYALFLSVFLYFLLILFFFCLVTCFFVSCTVRPLIINHCFFCLRFLIVFADEINLSPILHIRIEKEVFISLNVVSIGFASRVYLIAKLG